MCVGKRGTAALRHDDRGYDMRWRNGGWDREVVGRVLGAAAAGADGVEEGLAVLEVLVDGKVDVAEDALEHRDGLRLEVRLRVQEPHALQSQRVL
eukprot:892695-Rhodomonas_salina.4